MASGLTSPFLPPFVGRQRELEFLEEQLTNVIGGKGELILIAGEAGIGKSRLAEELGKYAVEKGFRTLVGRCVPGAASPYLPFQDAFEDYFRVETASLPSNLRMRKTPSETGLLGWLRGPSEATEPEKSRDAWSDPERILHSALEFLIEGSNQEAILLTLEDLHWADSASVQLLHFLARNTEKFRVLIVGTYRPEDVASPSGGTIHPLHESLRAMKREGICHEISLSPLSSEELRYGLEGMMGARIDLELLQEISKESGGNPLFAIESLRFLLQTGAIYQQDGTWRPRSAITPDIPSTVREVILGRIDRLPEEKRHLLEYAAVVGETFDPALLEEALQLERLYLLETFESIEKNFQLIKHYDEQYRFSHEKVRQTIYQEISTIRRKELHRAIAHALERKPRDENLYAGLSLHFFEAGELPKSSHYSALAGEFALRRGAAREAIEFFERVLRAEGSVQSSPERNFLVSEGLGDAYEALGLYEKALTQYEDALKTCREPKERIRILRKGAELPIGPRAKEFLDKTESLGQIDPLENGRIERIRAENAAAAGDFNEAFQHISKAADLIEKDGSPEEITITLLLNFWLHISAGNVEAAHDTLKRANGFLNDPHGPKTEGWIDIAWGMFHLCAGNFHDALESMRKGIAIFSEIGLHSDLAQLYMSTSWVFYVLDDYASARREAESSLEQAQKTEYPHLQLWAHSMLTQIALRQERLAEAGQLMQSGSKIYESIQSQTESAPFYSWWLERHSIAYYHSAYGDYLAAKRDWTSSMKEWTLGIKMVKTAVFGAFSEAYFSYDYTKYALAKQGLGEDAKEILRFVIQAFDKLGNRFLTEKTKKLAETL